MIKIHYMHIRDSQRICKNDILKMFKESALHQEIKDIHL